MLSTKTVMLGAALVGLHAATAGAADLPPVYDVPVYQDVPEIVPVEIGSGWYLRGDAGYAFGGDTFDKRYTDYSSRGKGYYDKNGSDQFSGSLGFGYQFTDMFRADVTAEYLGGGDYDARFESGCPVLRDTDSGAVRTTGRCENHVTANGDLYNYMINGYADLGTFMGITPYVGAGAGVANLRASFKETRVCNQVADPAIDCFPTTANGVKGAAVTDVVSDFSNSSWNFSYALMAGVGYDISRNLKLDVGYRYFSVPNPELFGGDTDKIDFHQIRAGVRYALW